MKKLRTGIFAAMAMLILILDANTAIKGANEGVMLCIRSIIPSLLPFFVLSIILINALSSADIPALYPIERLLRIPRGSGSIFLIGILGGYPVGAQAIAQKYNDGILSKTDAKRMLGFCSNAGPSFLFGIVACKFADVQSGWLLWLIHIVSAMLVGFTLPYSSTNPINSKQAKKITIPDALQRSLRILALVCGWVILFRVVLSFFTRWFLWFFPVWLQVAICGLLELANGCCALDEIANDGLRFVVCSGLLSYGGLCVAMQTASVTDKLGFGQYFPGKILQFCISITLAFIVQHFLYDPYQRLNFSGILLIFPIIATVTILYLHKKEKNSSIPALYGV